jgi:hypothetical protein
MIGGNPVTRDDDSMGYREELSEGIEATLDRPPIDAKRAVQRSITALGSRAELLSETLTSMTIAVLPRTAVVSSAQSPVVLISFTAVGRGTRLHSRIVRHTATRSRWARLLPLGPKVMLGRHWHRRLLQAIEQEIRALDPIAVVNRR